ncbi:aldehyde dehydrogenase family protein [Amycolatopsis magusensis]|uniref:aldehyde dehydrogenase family protein n=1 Tax=Amycolatopsis magusensis TaxID=882444 RepID=UPI0024A9D638|nr:aldehyde dehydrogenase family protein [Amycolatopsis magusensis]MDI5978861.1 aldehyde dehydrogenase family protein [Amycolatopsis magusensis]
MEVRDAFYSGGSWVRPASTRAATIEVVDPTTELTIGRAPLGGAEDVDRAVRAAAAAFPGWSRTPPADRLPLVRRVGELIAAHADDLTGLIVAEVGTPRAHAREIQVDAPAAVFELTATEAAGYPFTQDIGTTRVLREAAGVAGLITPWNFPLQEIAAKVAPALAAGCTMVVKPSEIAPLAAFRLAELVAAAGFPPGVFNLVLGRGEEAGEALVRHPLVDLISFTGSTAAGKRVARLAADGVKRVSLELGGKSANILLDDADFDRAVTEGVAGAFLNAGQTCDAPTRMLVPRSRLAEAEELAAAAAREFVVGDPRDAATTLGPVISKIQRDRVARYLHVGTEQGARLLAGGSLLPAKGFFVEPTVFSDVDPRQTIANEEIFGPVLALMPYTGEAEAVRIANGTPYGLSAAVWSADPGRAHRVSGLLRAGQVFINGAGFDLSAPFGGYKQSGYGRQGGRFGLEAFLETKALLR